MSAATVCPVDHSDATCEECGNEHVEIGWAHVCRSCWDTFVRAGFDDEGEA